MLQVFGTGNFGSHESSHNMTYRLTLSLLVLVALNGSCNSRNQEPASGKWPGWRGPESNGISSDGSYPVQWNVEKNLGWKVGLPGTGCSTPAVWNDSIIVTSRDQGQDTAFAYDWSGALRWKTSIGMGRRGKHRHGSGSNPSPVTDGKGIFVYFKSGNVAALDFSGNLAWKTNLQGRFGADSLYWDLGTSPVLTEQDVIVAVMHKGESFLAAFDKESGELSWKVPRNYVCPVEGDHSYATPTVIHHDGREAILVWGAEHLTAHDAADGKIIWSASGFNPEQKNNWVVVASVVVAGDVAIVPYGRGIHLAGIRLGGDGDVTETHRLWTRTDIGTFVPTPVVADGRVYILRDSGGVVCLDAESGETLWQAQLPRHRLKYYASPVVADGKLYATREDGVVIVAHVTDKFKILATNKMGERMIASPVPINGKILLRGRRHLFCVEAR